MLTRNYGPEPGLAFGSPGPGNNVGQFGMLDRLVGSDYSAVPDSLLKDMHTRCGVSMTFDKKNAWNYFDHTTAMQWSVKMKYTSPATGKTYSNLPAVIPYFWNTQPGYGLNIADPSFVDYYLGTYVPDVLMAKAPMRQNNAAVSSGNPIIVDLDTFNVDVMSFYGIINPENPAVYVWGGSKGLSMESGFSQSSAEWTAGWKTLFQTARQKTPEILLCPHVVSQQPAIWEQLSTIYADVGALQHEDGVHIRELIGASPYSRIQLLSTIQFCYWFANQAAPVLPGQMRLIDWGIVVDNEDIQTAFGEYCLIRGTNTFFSAQDGTLKGVAFDPTKWLPQANRLGDPASSSAVLFTQTSGQRQGYGLFQRDFPNGKAFLNMSGSTQTISFTGFDWNGTPITTLSLQDAKGTVVFNQ